MDALEERIEGVALDDVADIIRAGFPKAADVCVFADPVGSAHEIEQGGNRDVAFATELIQTIQPRHRTLLLVALFLHDIAKGRVEDHSIAGARIARRFCPRLGLTAAETELVAWLVEVHLVMSTVAQSRDLSDRKTIENFAAVVQSLERMKVLCILTVADIRAVGPGVWNGWKAQLQRTLYYETEPVLTGGFSELNRAERVAQAKAEFRAEIGDWPGDAVSTSQSVGVQAFTLIAPRRM